MIRALLAFLALTCASVSAFAQSTYPTPYGGRVAGVVPLQCDTSGANCASISQKAYSAVLTGQAGYATSTDLFSLRNPVGSGKVIRVRAFGILAQATSATLDTVTIYKRVALDTGGSPAVIPAAQFDSNDAAPVAVAQVYTAAPTIVDGAAPKLCVNTVITGTLTSAPTIYGTTTGGSLNCGAQSTNDLIEPITLRPGEELTINRGGVAQPAGYLFTAIVQWTEN